MKKIVLFLASILLTINNGYAQSAVTLKAGTLVQVRNEHHLKAADARIGQQIMFKVTRDVEANGVVVIPAGTPVLGEVYEAKRSAMWGTRGRLGITIQEISLPDGTKVPLNKRDIYIKGRNRTPLAIALSIFYVVPGFLVTGSRAEIPAGYEATAEVAWPVKISVNGYDRGGEQKIQEQREYSGASRPAAQQGQNSSPLPKFPFAATIIKTDGSTVDVIIHDIKSTESAAKLLDFNYQPTKCFFAIQ